MGQRQSQNIGLKENEMTRQAQQGTWAGGGGYSEGSGEGGGEIA